MYTVIFSLEIEPATTECRPETLPLSHLSTSHISNQQIMIIARPINRNVSCKLHPYSLQRTRSPPEPRLPRGIELVDLAIHNIIPLLKKEICTLLIYVIYYIYKGRDLYLGERAYVDLSLDWFGLVSLFLMAYQLFLGYLMPNPFS